jgi:hypothetical protein
MLVECVTELLKDGEWHYIQDIARELDQPEEEVLEILQFCAEFNIIIFNKSNSKVRIYERFTRL